MENVLKVLSVCAVNESPSTLQGFIMNDIRELTPSGSMINGALTSFGTVLTWQPLFMVKNSIMTGAGLPALKSLYRGYPINACCDISNQSVAFFSNNYFATVIMKSKPLSPMEQILGGLFSGMSASPLLCLCDRIMVVQQLHKGDPVTQKMFTINQVIREILKVEGAKGFMRGFTPTVMRESTNAACFFGLQKSIKLETEKWIEDKSTASTVAYLISGLVSGVFTTPSDLVKTNMQKTIGDKSSVVEVVTGLIQKSNHGAVRALFRGCLARSGMMGCLMGTMGPLSAKIQPLLPDVLFKDKTA